MTKSTSNVTDNEETSPDYHSKFTGMIIAPDGVTRHFQLGAYGRAEDLPALICPDGSQHWYVPNPKRGEMGQQASLQHRGSWHKTVDAEDKPVFNAKGKQEITVVSLDLPAVVKENGDAYHYYMGKLHRDGGNPAVILADGTKRWFDKGTCVGFQLPGGVMEKIG